MNILINFSTLKKGGGQNVALNFIECLNRKGILNEFHYVVVENSEIHKFLLEHLVNNIIMMPQNPIKRMFREFINGKSIVEKNNISIIYSYFGIGLYPRSVLQVSGSADSNIYFPEINFWSDYRIYKKLIRNLIDNYRIWGLKRMDAIIFENEIMMERGRKIYKLKNTTFIKPSINTDYQIEKYNLPESALHSSHRGLFFCGWQRNKNFMLIPDLAIEFKNHGYNFHFIITAPLDQSEDHKLFMEKVKYLQVESYISIVGQVKKNQIVSLYEQIDFVFLLSKLESFSNNIIEAWYFKRPLIISDELWSKSICKNAAIYVSRNDIKYIVNRVILLIENEQMKNDIVSEGKNILNEYPTIDQRTEQELEYIKKIYENN
jgi:glycosyltransferase involved in cell wall biosynthesis